MEEKKKNPRIIYNYGAIHYFQLKNSSEGNSAQTNVHVQLPEFVIQTQISGPRLIWVLIFLTSERTQVPWVWCLWLCCFLIPQICNPTGPSDQNQHHLRKHSLWRRQQKNGAVSLVHIPGKAEVGRFVCKPMPPLQPAPCPAGHTTPTGSRLPFHPQHRLF